MLTQSRGWVAILFVAFVAASFVTETEATDKLGEGWRALTCRNWHF
jgi:hypothetical protein